MSEKKDEETPEPKARRIDMRALDRGVRKALAIKPRERERKRQAKQKRDIPPGGIRTQRPDPSPKDRSIH